MGDRNGNRKAAAASPGGAAERAGAGDAGADAKYAAFQAVHRTRITAATAGAGKGMTGIPNTRVPLLSAALLASAVVMATQMRVPHEEIPAAGVRLGEIIGWRVWDLPGDFITSCIVAKVWAPGKIVKGDVRKAGVHSWKTFEDAVAYATGSYGVHVVGRVALWGEVVEHERGYRAEFAKPISFDGILGEWGLLASRRLRKLRELYGLEAAP